MHILIIRTEEQSELMPMSYLEAGEFAWCEKHKALVFREFQEGKGARRDFVALTDSDAGLPVVDGFSSRCDLEVEKLPKGTRIMLTL